jgi:hypothetical protein
MAFDKPADGGAGCKATALMDVMYVPLTTRAAQEAGAPW